MKIDGISFWLKMIRKVTDCRLFPLPIVIDIAKQRSRHMYYTRIHGTLWRKHIEGICATPSVHLYYLQRCSSQPLAQFRIQINILNLISIDLYLNSNRILHTSWYEIHRNTPPRLLSLCLLTYRSGVEWICGKQIFHVKSWLIYGINTIEKRA